MFTRARSVGMLLVVALSAAACSSGGDTADSTSADGDAAVFDSSVLHEVEVSFDDADYDAMIDTFEESGEKEWIEASVTIDGVSYERVGLRLKGNSSLMGLGGGMPEMGGRRGAGTEGGAPAEDTAGSTEATPPSTDAPTTEATQPADTNSTEGTAPAGEGQGGGPGGGFGPGGGASADVPEGLPWLIRFDEFVEGQDHQGYEDIVIRSNTSETSLNEAVALDLLEQTGLASQEAAATSFSVNGSDAILRLAVENPDDDAWQEANFAADGALYKAESTGDWSYRGDDPAAYEDVFDQEGGKDVADLTPLIEFLQFLDESDDATFAAELPERLDVDAFATYLAAMEVLGNFDDIDGPGNNAYLWYDVGSEQFSVVPWDMNMALGGMSGFGGGEGGRPEGFEPPADGRLPEGVEPPADGEMPEGFQPPADGERPEGFPGGGSNVLVERFHANADFEAQYQEALTELRASLFESGAGDEVLTSWVDVLTEHATDLVPQETITEEADAISEQFDTE